MKEVVGLEGLKGQQIRKASSALLKHVAKQQAAADQLLADDEIIYLTIALMKVPVSRRNDKPIRLSIPHPLLQYEGAEVCLIVKDHKGEGHKEAKQYVKQQKLAGITKIVGVSKLRAKYEAPEAKRQLCSLYDIFLADERVIPSLPKLLGKTFFRKKKQPVPVDLSTRDWGRRVKDAVQATYMFRPTGNSISIKVGRSSFTSDQCSANIEKVLQQAVKHLPKQWAGVRACFLKTADSLALPIFQRLPEEEEALKILPES